MEGLFAAAAAKLGDGQALSRFMQNWGGEHATLSSADAASLSSDAAPSAAADTHPRDWQPYTREEWDDWNACGPRRKEAKAEKPKKPRFRNPRRNEEEEEEAEVEEAYEKKKEVPKEEEVAKEEPNKEAEAEAREEAQATWTHKVLRDAQQNPLPRDNIRRPRGGQHREYWQGWYDRQWREQGQSSGSNTFGINKPPPPLPVQHRLPPPPPRPPPPTPPPPPIPKMSDDARVEALNSQVHGMVFWRQGKKQTDSIGMHRNIMHNQIVEKLSPPMECALLTMIAP